MEREKLEQKAKDLAFDLNIGYYDLDFSCYTDFGLEMEIKKMEKVIKARDKGNLYININDFQCGEWAIGCVGTLKNWREKAIYWCDSDGNIELIKALKNYKIKNKDLIEFINDYWDIEIVKYEKNIDYDIEEYTYLGLY